MNGLVLSNYKRTVINGLLLIVLSHAPISFKALHLNFCKLQIEYAQVGFPSMQLRLIWIIGDGTKERCDFNSWSSFNYLSRSVRTLAESRSDDVTLLRKIVADILIYLSEMVIRF